MSASAHYDRLPFGLALVIIKKGILDILQSPVLFFASCFTGDSFEATDSFRALFLLPHSFIAHQSRELTENENLFVHILAVFAMTTPSLMIAIFLAWRVTKNAKQSGLPRRARRCWLIATIAFGLPAYITYRLTRSKETMVTCLNCGQLRRPDMGHCHNCNRPWHLPDLTPPAWRVIDG